jgi:nucleoside-diphosphate kinase
VDNSLIILKPDAVQRQLTGRIMTRFEEKGIQIVGCKMMKISVPLAEKHYAPHKGKPFYKPLLKYMTNGPVLVLALKAPGVIGIARKLMGATFGCDAEPGTIRGDFGASKGFNLIHGSDSPEAAETEISLFFSPEELMGEALTNEHWLYGDGE